MNAEPRSRDEGIAESASNAGLEGGRGAFLTLVTLWLAGVGLRLTILALPPVLPQVRADLHFDQTGVGVLSGLPPLLFALAAIPGSLLIARFGATRALTIGLLTAALGGALRALSPDFATFCLTTIVMSMGVAVMQPAMPPLVRDWAPQRIGFATAIYTNGLLMGEVLPVALSAPIVLPLVRGQWRAGLVVWSIPLLLTSALTIWRSRTGARIESGPPGALRWRPNWRDGRMWRLGFMFGAVNSIYFTANGFIPGYLVSHGASALVGTTLTALNLGQIPASALLILVSRRLIRTRWPYAANGAIALVGVFGLIFFPGPAAAAFAALVGFACAGTLILALALPALLSERSEVHSMSAGMFTISYICALLVSVLSGALWDMTGDPGAAFAPSLACAVALIALSPGLRVRR